MKNTLTLIGAIVVSIGVIAAAAVIAKKCVDKMAEKKKKEEEDALFDCDGTCCCDLGFDDDEEEGIDWGDIPVADDDDISESMAELDNLDVSAEEEK